MNNDEKEKEFYKLRDLKGNIESEAFQEMIIKPIFTELESLKNAYDCQSLRELSEVKGKKIGLKFIIKLFKQINTDYKNSKFDLQNK